MTFPSPTKTYHTEPYPAIDPRLPELSTKGKNIVVTGGGSGIGPAIAQAFARSGASHIALLGRTENTLLRSKQEIEAGFPNTKISTFVADITKQEALDQALSNFARSFGAINVLVANAGYLPDPASIADSSLEDWFNGFDVNVKGNFNVLRAFLPHAAEDAAVLNISTGVVQLPYVKGHSAYHTSKLASAKLFDYVHQEYPELFVLNIHPGVFLTSMGEKSAASGTGLPLDDSESIISY